MQFFNDSQDSRLNSNLELLARQVVEGFITGLHKSPFHGFSVEFAEHSAYNSGDPVRNIDWKLFARTDKLYTKRYEEETNLRCQFMIDVSSSMYFPQKKYNKLRFAVQSVAALIYLLNKQRDAFGLSLFSEKLVLNTPLRSTTAHQKFIFTKLEEILKEERLHQVTNLPHALHQVAEFIHKRSLVIIFSDLLNNGNEDTLDALFASLQHLKFNNHEVIIFNVIDKVHEVEFKFENRPHQFIDLETGDVMQANAANIREAYLSSYHTYRKMIALKCAQYKIDLIDADMNGNFSDVLSAYLIKRHRIG